jgi:hypothetical protein
VDALAHEEVGCLVGPVLDVGEREAVFLALGVCPDHRGPVGLDRGDVVHDVIGPVEVLLVVEAEMGDLTLEVP